MNATSILLSMLETFATIAPSLSNNKAVQNIIKILIELIPVLVQEYQAVIPMVRNVISALSTNGVATPAQITELEALNAKIDAEFDLAASKAQAEDAAN